MDLRPLLNVLDRNRATNAGKQFLPRVEKEFKNKMEKKKRVRIDTLFTETKQVSLIHLMVTLFHYNYFIFQNG